MELDVLMSVEQAAIRLGGVSKWTIYAWLSQGKLRRTIKGHSGWREITFAQEPVLGSAHGRHLMQLCPLAS
jgi:excisionase family DNA binding protein